ncbi:DUF3499 domain-containing protein, partial [Micromonospora sp. AMSO31t]|uniref:DUF3499 domain-containing protein n=1 Tax=Micromonospora sp. AMSO31t TaxID=2650566 RepID=UPI00351BCAE2
MRSPRRCSRNGCPRQAVATLTYVYNESTAVVGPLAAFAEPHTYDLCEPHARNLTAPRGWDVVRHEGEFEPPPTWCCSTPPRPPPAATPTGYAAARTPRTAPPCTRRSWSGA